LHFLRQFSKYGIAEKGVMLNEVKHLCPHLQTLHFVPSDFFSDLKFFSLIFQTAGGAARNGRQAVAGLL